jgi:poly(A) polymerase
MPIRPLAAAVVKKLVDAGHIAYFAGGWVRDFLMKRPSDDIDIATSASVEQIQALFPKTIPVGVAFGIVIVVYDKHQFEVATFRKDQGYLDGRRPTGIEPASPQEDAQRRDFTINGMFYDPIKDQLLDYTDGQADIKRGVIKAIGNPRDRFLEDRLRMMRAVRYATRFDFTIDPETYQAIQQQAETLLPAVAMERVWQEFKKMSQFSHFDKGLIILHELHLLPTIFPELKGLSVDEISRRVAHIEQFPKSCPAIAELLELFPKYTVEESLALCEYLKLSKEEKNFVLLLFHAKTLAKTSRAVEPIEWAKLYADPLADVALEVIAAHYARPEREIFLGAHQQRKELLRSAIVRIQTKNPVIRSEHLMLEGIAPGKKMGVLLNEAERIAVNESLDDIDAIMKRLKHLPLWSNEQ